MSQLDKVASEADQRMFQMQVKWASPLIGNDTEEGVKGSTTFIYQIFC
jgi:hypothetical protein